MNILVTYAVEAEFAPWRALNMEKVTIADITVYRTLIGGKGLVGDGRREINLGRNDNGSSQEPV